VFTDVKFTMLHRRIGRILMAAACVLGAVVPASIAATATPAFADACTPIAQGSSNGVPNYELPTNCSNVVIPQVHRCQMVQLTPTGAEADECADMYFTNSGGSSYIRGVGKFYCQGTYSQCAGMNVTTTMVYQPQGEVTSFMVQPVNYVCNTTSSPCPTGGVGGAYRNWTGSGTFDTGGALGDTRCVLGQTFDVRDGWSGFGRTWPNVMKVKGTTYAVHETTELSSIKANFCFD
jgi:hypothetical protein